MGPSLFWEDFAPGMEFSLGGRTVGEADLAIFAGATGDHFPHTDEEYAKRTQFGRRIAHGAFVFSVSVGLMTQGMPLRESLVAFYGVDRLRFTAPVAPGDTITFTKRVVQTAAKGAELGLVTFESTVRNQNGKTVLVYADQLLLRRRPAPAREEPA